MLLKKTMEAYIPSMASREEAYAKDPDLRRYNALERFQAMRVAEGETASLDLSRAEALRDAITVYDPAVHQVPHPPRPGQKASAPELQQPVADDAGKRRQRGSTLPTVQDENDELQELRARVEALEHLVRKSSESVPGGSDRGGPH